MNSEFRVDTSKQEYVTGIETRLKYLEDCASLRDLITIYCTAVDSLSDVDTVVNCFAKDAVFDLTGIGSQKFRGHSEIRSFFVKGFADMKSSAHFITNYRTVELNGDRAIASAYVMAVGEAHTGPDMMLHVRYAVSYERSGKDWKFCSLVEELLSPTARLAGKR